MKKVFISYSWDSEAHCTWVRMLAEQLERESGLEVRLDQWLRPGDSLTEYMEEIASADFCIVVCTPAYARKANKRSGGVGYEAQIITTQIYDKMQIPGEIKGDIRHPRFVPILREGDFPNALPTFFGSVKTIDFRREDQFSKLLEELLQELLGQPRYIPPPKGSATVFLPDPDSSQVPESRGLIREEATENKRVSALSPEDVRFGVTLGFAMGRLEFVDGSKFPNVRSDEQAIRSDIRQILLAKNEDPAKICDGDAQTIMKIIIDYFAVRDMKKHTAILTWIGALRLSISDASSSVNVNVEMKKLALSAFMEIDDSVIAEPKNLFINMAKIKHYTIRDICKILSEELYPPKNFIRVEMPSFPPTFLVLLGAGLLGRGRPAVRELTLRSHHPTP